MCLQSSAVVMNSECITIVEDILLHEQRLRAVRSISLCISGSMVCPKSAIATMNCMYASNRCAVEYNMLLQQQLSLATACMVYMFVQKCQYDVSQVSGCNHELRVCMESLWLNICCFNSSCQWLWLLHSLCVCVKVLVRCVPSQRLHVCIESLQLNITCCFNSSCHWLQACKVQLYLCRSAGRCVPSRRLQA